MPKIKDVGRHSKLIMEMAKNDFKTKFIGSKIGVAWGFIQPLVTIILYWIVFEVGFKSSKVEGNFPFVLWFYKLQTK